jgi:long-chain acyl-CoA synthetase
MIGEQPMTLRDIHVLYDFSIYNCKHFGPYTALIYDDQRQTRAYTNVEVAREATQLAVGLKKLGIEKGDRIIVMMPNSPEVIISYQAIARTGAIIIPVLPLLKGPEVHYIAQNSGAKAIITSSILLPLLQGALTDVPTMQYIIVTDLGGEQATERLIPYRAVVASGADHADKYLQEPENPPTSDDTAIILYTSGTTGRPKGVMLSHRNLVSNATANGEAEEVDPTLPHEVTLAVLPLAHAYGILVSNLAYVSGWQVVMLPRFEPTAVLSAIERYRVVAFGGVPAMFVALLNAPDADKYDTSSLQWCGSGSAPLPVEVLKAFEQKFHCEIREGYGLSEGTTALTTHPAGVLRKPGSVGLPLPGVEIRIVDENDNPLPTGEIGEIVSRGPNTMQGYFNMPEETQAALRNGWLHTGDMGYFDEDGYLYVVERKKDLIIRGGFNIYPRDVEEVLNSHPAVVEAAVVGVPSERMGEEVKAYVVTRAPVEAEELMLYCRERLANYKTPSQIEFLPALPRNPIGKIDKKELRKRHVN